jgi:hypothetical protein
VTEPQNSELVHVIVAEHPQRVFAVFRDKVHAGRWRTGNPGNVKAFGDSNASLLNAALYSWDGQTHFTISYGQLLAGSGGWGVEWPE